MNKALLKISFNRSTSQYFGNAIRVAKKIEGYKELTEGKLNKYSIETYLDLNKIKKFNYIIDLVDLIANWKSLRIIFNEKDIKPWRFKDKSIEIKNCFLKRENVGEYYCYGEPSAISSRNRLSLAFISGSTVAVTLLISSCREKSSRNSSVRPASTLDRSSTSLISDSR